MKFIFVETPIFTKMLLSVSDDESYRQFQAELAENPDSGNVLRETGGLRKVRMRLSGRGKSGSARVLYLYFPKLNTILFYYLFTKGNVSNINKAALREIRHEVESIKEEYEKRARDRVRRK